MVLEQCSTCDFVDDDEPLGFIVTDNSLYICRFSWGLYVCVWHV